MEVTGGGPVAGEGETPAQGGIGHHPGNNDALVEITVVTASLTKEYDGTPASDSEVYISSGALLQGHTMKVVRSESIQNVGWVSNAVEVVITDRSGLDVTSMYSIAVEEGTLTVVGREVTVRTGTAHKVYDGEPLVCEKYEIIAGNLVDGHKATATFPNSQTDVGMSSNPVYVKIIDEEGADVSHNYEITVSEGALLVDSRAVKIKTGSAEKVYDGEPLVCKKYEIIAGNLVDGHKATVKFTNSQTDVGESVNAASVVILDDKNADVTYNYAITVLEGELKVNTREITVRTGSAEKVYDGKPLVCEEYEITSGSVLDSHSIKIAFTGKQTEAGRSLNYASALIFDDSGREATTNYKIEYIYGYLVVTQKYEPETEGLPIEITVTSASLTKVYDGGFASCAEWFVSSGELLPGHTIDVVVSGTIRDVGCVNNTIKSVSITDADGKNVTQQYNIKTDEGILTVEKRTLKISTGSASKPYDGQPLSCDEYWISYGDLPEGFVLELSLNNFQTKRGTTANEYGNVRIIDARGNVRRAATENFDVRAGVIGRLIVY